MYPRNEQTSSTAASASHQRVAVLDPVPRLVQAEQLRQHEVQERERGGDEQQSSQDPPAGQPDARPFVAVRVRLPWPRCGGCDGPPAPFRTSSMCAVAFPPAAAYVPARSSSAWSPADRRRYARLGARRRAADSSRPARLRRSGRPRNAPRGTRAPARASPRTSTQRHPLPARPPRAGVQPMSDVAKCSDGMAASGFPPRTS